MHVRKTVTEIDTKKEALLIRSHHAAIPFTQLYSSSRYWAHEVLA